jgi:hypothetical protein
MKIWIGAGVLLLTGVLAGFSLGPQRASGQAPAAVAARTADGTPDLNGVWQALTTASWDILDHNADEGVPGGQGLVEGNDIPYQPWAAARRKENYEKRVSLDPLNKCYLPGVPRLTYMPFPFEITQSPGMILVAYEFAHATRQIYTDGSTHPEGLIDFWMGDSRGRWENDTLVVDVSNMNDQTWFDRSGNFHSEAMHLVERYTPAGPNHIKYEVTIEDPKVFTRPWTMSTVLYRRLEKHVQLVPYECLEYQEPFLRWDEPPAPGIPGPPKK